MILVLGGSGYVGGAVVRELGRRGMDYSAPGHGELDASDAGAVGEAVARTRPDAVISAVGFTGRPNIDGTEVEKLRCLRANTLVPGVLADVMRDAGIPWGHVSSGCIFDGVREDGSPFTEDDPPNFAFGDPRAGWYARTKALGEILLESGGDCRIWRLRIPFDERDSPRNYLSKLIRYEKLLEVTNSISHLGDFAAACVESLVRPIPPGIYNVTNPGAVTTSRVAEKIRAHGLCDHPFRFFSGEEEFLAPPGRVKRASCVMSSEKLARAGIPLRGVEEALDDALGNWEWDRRQA
jgi:3,5-epimerase/4-reductase